MLTKLQTLAQSLSACQKLQKFTRPALKVLGFNLRQLARILSDLSVDRIQELLNGQSRPP